MTEYETYLRGTQIIDLQTKLAQAVDALQAASVAVETQSRLHRKVSRECDQLRAELEKAQKEQNTIQSAWRDYIDRVRGYMEMVPGDPFVVTLVTMKAERDSLRAVAVQLKEAFDAVDEAYDDSDVSDSTDWERLNAVGVAIEQKRPIVAAAAKEAGL